MKRRWIALAAASLMLNGAGIVATPAQAALPFCVKDAMIVADNSGYDRDSPEWQELYDLWYEQCMRSQPPGPTDPVPCTPGMCGEWPGDNY